MTATGAPEGTASVNSEGTAPVVLVVPADAAFLAVLLTACAGLAARLDLDLDEIEDLRIAVDEASTLLIADAEPGSRLRADFWLSEDSLDIEVSGPSTRLPERESIAWSVLEALVGIVDVRSADDGVPAAVRLTHHRRRPRR